MVWSLNCYCEEEPAGFHPDGVRGFSVRLSVGTDEVDQVKARDELVLLLSRLQEINSPENFVIYQLKADKLSMHEVNGMELLSEEFDSALSKHFSEWLGAYPDDPLLKSGAKTFFTSFNADSSQHVATDHLICAQDVILATASRLAPLPQALHLSFVLRIPFSKLPSDPTDSAILAIVPRFDGESPKETYDVELDSNRNPPGEVDVEISSAGGIRRCRMTLIRRLVLDDPSTNVSHETGFCKGSDETAAVHAALQRFEQRAGSLFTGFVAAGEFRWRGDGALLGLQDADQRRQAATRHTLLDTQHVRRLAWRAVTSLASALDPLLLALCMPGRTLRDGPLLAPLFDLILAQAEASHGSVVDRARLRAALRAGVNALVQDINAQAANSTGQFVEVLSKLCIEEPGEAKETWLGLLLKAFAKQDSWISAVEGWQGIQTAQLDDAPKIDQQARELERNLADLNERLIGETGVERALMLLLRQPAVLERLLAFLKGALSTGDDGAKDVLETALQAFEKKLGSEINGALVARQAAGSLLADLLVKGVSNNSPMEVANLRSSAAGWRFWHWRFGLETATGADAGTVPAMMQTLMSALILPVPRPAEFFAQIGSVPDDFQDGPSKPVTAKLALSALADNMQASVLVEIFPEAGDRFIPDSSPRPLAIHIAVDPAADDSETEADEFSAAFAGMSLLMRRSFTNKGNRPPWSYANLAEIEVAERTPSDENTKVEAVFSAIGMQPLPTTVDDGRRNLFQTYDGIPFSSAAFRPESPGAMFETDYPERTRAPQFKPAPELAYGAHFELVAHAVGRSGSLPIWLQDDLPWRPESTIEFPADGLLTRVPYARTTAIGQTTIAEVGDRKRIGVAPKNVQPLSADYPRIALSAGDAPFLDVFRNTDGSGAIPLPSIPGQDVRLTLRNIWNWGEQKGEFQCAVMESPDASLDTASVIGNLTLALAPGAVVSAAVAIVQTAGGEFTVSLNGSTPRTFKSSRNSVWLRLRFDSSEPGASISMDDPSGDMKGHAAASRPIPEKLLLLGLGDAWLAPFGTAAGLLLGFPRVGYQDFERWINNPSLKKKVFASLPPKQVEYFCNCLVACQIGRGFKRYERLAALMDRLPDPAVTGVQLEVAPVDCMRNSPDALKGSFPALKRCISIPSLGQVLADVFAKVLGMSPHDNPPKFEPEKFERVLAAIDDRYSRRFGATCSAQEDAVLAWELGNDLSPNGVRVPEGLTVQLRVRPIVDDALFDEGEGVSVIDRRLLQYVTGRSEGDVKGLLFDGASLLAEAMITLEKPMPVMRDQVRRDPWRMTRQDWTKHADRIVDHYGGRSRQYELAATPGVQDWAWRQLGWIDVQTQRWRFMGMPVDQWPTRHGALHRINGDVSFVPSSKGDAGREVVAFELQAFHRRLDSDVEVKTTQLSTLGHKTSLITVRWDKPTATWFRHRLVLRSRYAGAMVLRSNAECEAWRERAPGDPSNVEHWRRVVMLADRGAIKMPRPQLRALMPLTVAPDLDVDGTPPIAAILHDEPFAYGGLAERVMSEVTTGVGYGGASLEGTGNPHDRVRALDLRKEVGPDPRLSYSAMPAAEAQLTVLAPEGPLGLTFDRTDGTGQVFPNSSWLLHPRKLVPGGHVQGPVGMEEHFVSVAMRRVLDPVWLVDEDNVSVSFDDTWWSEHACTGGKDVIIELADAAAKLAINAIWCEPDGPDIVVFVDRAVVDLSALYVKPSDPSEQVTLKPDPKPLVLCRIPGGIAGKAILAFMHTPVDRQNASLSVFLLPRSDDRAHQKHGNLPLLLGGIDWSIPVLPADPQQADGPKAMFVMQAPNNRVRTSASQPTAMNWVRTNRNFDMVNVGGLDGRDRLDVRSMVAIRGTEEEEGLLSVMCTARADRDKDVWIRSSQSTGNFPVHAQRHVAALFSTFDDGLGRPVEQLLFSHMLTGVSTVINDKDGFAQASKLRLVEFEVPAQIIGFIPGQSAALPEAFRFSYFDLMSIGKTAGDRCLSLHFRVIGAKIARSNLRSLKIGLRADDARAWQPLELTRPANAKAEVVALQLDLMLDAEWGASIRRGRWLTATGGSEELELPVPNTTLPLASFDSVKPEGFALTVQDAGENELWFEIGLLVASSPTFGFGGAVDFDWLFGSSGNSILDGLSAGATSESSLRMMYEAQARVISVSPSIPILDEPLRTLDVKDRIAGVPEEGGNAGVRQSFDRRVHMWARARAWARRARYGEGQT